MEKRYFCQWLAILVVGVNIGVAEAEEPDQALPEIREEISQSPANMPDRIEEALKRGPVGLEELILEIKEARPLDVDGRYISTAFYHWFDSPGLVRDPVARRDQQVEHDERVKQLLEQWEATFPESKPAKLAAANSMSITHGKHAAAPGHQR